MAGGVVLDLAQGFTTGANAAGYTLESVGFRFAERASSKAPTVTLHSGAPTGPLVATLSGPGSVPGGMATFTAPSGTVLAASTSYYVVMAGGRFSLFEAGGHGEDAGAASGWRIHDRRHWRLVGQKGFHPEVSPHVVTVYGTAKDGETVATVPANTPTAKPTASDNTVTVNEDTSYTFKAADFGFKGAATGDTLASVRVVTVPAKGRLTLSGTPVKAGRVVSRADIDAGRLAFAPAANANGDPYASFTFRVGDGAEESASAYTMTVDVTAVNDPATGAPTIHGTAKVGEKLVAATGGIRDPDVLPSSFTYQWIRVDGSGETDISGATSSSYTLVTADQGKRIKVKVSFTDGGDSSESLTSEATDAVEAAVATASTEATETCNLPDFGTRRPVWKGTVTVEDWAGWGAVQGFLASSPKLGALDNRTVALDSVSYNIWGLHIAGPNASMEVGFLFLKTTPELSSQHQADLSIHVCDDSFALADSTIDNTVKSNAELDWTGVTTRKVWLSLPADTSPTAADGRVTAGEDSSYAFSAADFGFIGADATKSLASVTVETLPGAGSLALDDTAVTAGVAATKADIDAGKLVFTPTANASGEDYASFTFKVSDGTDTSASAYTMTIDVTPVNDPATGAPWISTWKGREWRVGNFVRARTGAIDDADGKPESDRFFHDWFIVSADGTEESDNFFGKWYRLREEDAGKKIRLRVSFRDKEGHKEKLTSLNSPHENVSVDGTVVRREFTILPRTGENSAPTAADAVVTAVRNTDYAFAASDFNFSDPDQGSDLWGVRIVTLPGAGTLALGGTAVTAEGWVDRSDIEKGRLVFTPGTDATGTGHASFTFKVGDGTAESASAYTMTVDVLATEGTASSASISVADASATEGPGASLSFRVTLNRAETGAVSVDYATSDGTATAGSDYTATNGTLTFAAGETAKTVTVAVLDDDVDDDGETVTLTLSNARPAAVRIADDTATGTIRNEDALPGAWTARFGRAVADQVVDAVRARMAAPDAPGTALVLGGRQVGSGSGGAAAGHAAAELADRFGDGPEGGSLAMSARDALLASSFLMAGDEGEGGRAFWGRMAETRFDGREGGIALDGEVATAMLGADWRRGRNMAGLIIAHSRGTGGYRGVNGGGALRSDVTGLYPWGRHAFSERLSLWGVVGHGQGDLVLDPGDGPPMRTGLDLTMGALGMAGVLLEPQADGGFGLSFNADAMAVRTGSAALAGDGLLSSARTGVSRLRIGIEGGRAFRLGNGSVLTPSLEIGLRRDGGDAETGFGIELGWAVAWSDPVSGLGVDVRARGLAGHEESGFRERGHSLSLSWDPRPESDLGPSLTASQAVGAPSAGLGTLMTRGSLAGLSGGDGGSGHRRTDLRFGYGLPAFGGRFTATPEAGVGIAPDGRDFRIGWRLGRAARFDSPFELEAEATRRETDGAGPGAGEAVNGVGLRMVTQW